MAEQNGEMLPGGPATTLQVNVSGPQLLAAAAFFMNGQIETLVRSGAPVEAVVDLLVGMTATLVARIDQPMTRQMIKGRIAQNFEAIVDQKEIEVRTTANGIIRPNGVAPQARN